jgi:hypothetical protein
MKTLRLFGCLAMLLLVGGCGHFNVEPRDSLTRGVPPPSGERSISIVYVHGIGCHDPGYSLPFQERLARRMGLVERTPVMTYYEFASDGLASSSQDFAMVKPPIDVETPPSDVWSRDSVYTSLFPWEFARRQQYRAALKDYRQKETQNPSGVTKNDIAAFGAFSNVCLDRSASPSPEPANSKLGPGVLVRQASRPGLKVTFYEVLWSPVSERRKRQNLEYDFAHGTVPRAANLTKINDRTLLNGGIKDSVLNGGIPDAVFYAGEGKYPIRKIVRTAICMALLKSHAGVPAAAPAPECNTLRQLQRDNSSEMVFFSESLGSRALLDTLSEMASASDFRQPAVIDELVKSPFFMFANQLPVFEIASQDYTSSFDVEAWPQSFNKDSTEGKDPYGVSLIDSCIGWAGNGYREISRTQGAIAALRDLRTGASPSPQSLETLRTTREARELAFLDRLREAATCRRMDDQFAGKVTDDRLADEAAESLEDVSPYQRLLLAWGVRNLREALQQPGPIGLDQYLQLKALQDLGSAGPGIWQGDPEAIAAEKARLKDMTLTVYAFSDANDILSWEVSKTFQDQFAMIDFRNVQRRIENPLLPLPGKAGLFVNPELAHMNYRFSDETLDVVMCVLGEPDERYKDPCQHVAPVPVANGREAKEKNTP